MISFLRRNRIFFTTLWLLLFSGSLFSFFTDFEKNPSSALTSIVEVQDQKQICLDLHFLKEKTQNKNELKLSTFTTAISSRTEGGNSPASTIESLEIHLNLDKKQFNRDQYNCLLFYPKYSFSLRAPPLV